jgi:hypothetical protein
LENKEWLITANKISKYGQNRLIIGLISLLSMSFVTSAPFESNPQDCELISVPLKKKKNQADEDNMSLPD